jgi:fructokinase
MIYAGVELGGTKCVAILARGPDDVLARETILTVSPDETMGRIESTLLDWKRSHGFDALGIASFGPLDLDRQSAKYGHTVTTTKPGWSDVDIAFRGCRAMIGRAHARITAIASKGSRPAPR